MKNIFAFLVSLLITSSAWNQCNVIATAMPQPATCSDACDGSILYLYQNLNMGSPGSPYIVWLYDSDGNTLSIQTYLTEITTIPFTNLCPDTYTITVQGNACSFTTMATVSSPAPIVVYANTTDPSMGASNGSAEIIVSGGTSPFTFSIDGGITFQGSNIFSGLDAGTYTVLVTDANGCEETVSFTLIDNTVCSVVVTANPTAMSMCYGSCTGALQYYYFDANGNNPYSIELIQGGTTLQTQTNNNANGNGTFTNLCGGVYTIQVTDAQGCTGMYPVTIFQPTQLLVTSVSTTDATAGNSNGAATINATGGTPGYTYSLNGTTYQASNIFTGLAAGVYIAYVKDNSGCISIFTFVIQTDPGCNFNVTALTTQPSCYGSCDGSINYIFSGSPSDPTFAINLEQNGNVIQSSTSTNQTVSGFFNGLCAGDYTITVYNSSGCQEIVNVTLSQPSYLNATYTTISATTGNSDGQINMSVNGGTAPYEYSIDNQATWQSSANFSGLAAGFYIVFVKDANGCMSIICPILSETSSCNFSLSATAFTNSCAYSCDGSIIYSFNDFANNPPYTIELIQGANTLQTNTVTMSNGGTGNFVGLCEGTYDVVITDANGCSDSQTLYVDAPNYLTVTGANITDASPGNSDGLAEIIVSGGTAPYAFSLDNGITWGSTNIITGLAAGFYILMVEDANGCSTIFCFVVNEDPGCTINTTLFLNQPISCYAACDGALSYAYTDAGSDGPYTITLSNNGVAVATDTQITTSFTGIFTGLCAGNYSITVTNASGCSSFVSNYLLSEPVQIVLTASLTDASTGNNNGVANINATGGSGQYQYSLNGIDYQNSSVFDTLSAGNYTAYVIDDNGCEAGLAFTINDNVSCTIVLTVFQTTSVTCAGMCDAQLNFAFNDVNTNPPYTVILTNSAGTEQSQLFAAGNSGSGNFTNLCADIYTVTVQDANGCISIQTYQINAPTYMSIMPTWINATAGNNDGSIDLNITGGTAPYQYSLDNQVSWNTGTHIPNLGVGFYIIYVKDANGCMQIVCVVLDDTNVISVVDLSDEILVYPNPTSGFVFVASTSAESVVVYNMSGQIIPTTSIIASNGIALDLSTTAAGIYLLEIKSLNGNFNQVKVTKN